MNTKIIGSYDKFINTFSKTGRVKNKMYRELHSAGMKEIRERVISKDKFVLMASEHTGKGTGAMTFGVDMNSGYVQKQTQTAKIMTFFDKQRSGIVKHFTDWQGNLVRKLTKNKAFANGETIDAKTVTEIPGKYVKTSEMNIYTPVRRSVKVEYANGDKYSFAEYENGNREYNRTIKGVDYSFTTKK